MKLSIYQDLVEGSKQLEQERIEREKKQKAWQEEQLEAQKKELAERQKGMNQ
ncbi:hypothetical protein ACTWQB_01970 [Piscibacillus sp. B03]|uniref:hypothetical protein n=1 Tax=Piscibacillus sp. B03 TaxID=3457430 RepID=UPI003FCDE921